MAQWAHIYQLLDVELQNTLGETHSEKYTTHPTVVRDWEKH